MIITKDFHEALKTVVSICPGRTTMPILTTVGIVGKDGLLSITGTDLEKSLTKQVAYDGEDFQTCVPGRELESIVATIKSPDCEFEYNANSRVFTLKFEGHKFTFKCLDYNEYPLQSEIKNGVQFFIDGNILADYIRKVEFASLPERNNHPVLGGINLKSKDSMFIACATDGFRLSYNKMMLGVADFEIIAQKSGLSELASILSGKIEVIISANALNVKGDNFLFTSQLLAGNYPDVERIIPSQHTTHFALSKSQFALALKRAQVFAKNSANIIRAKVTKEKLIMSSYDDTGSGETYVELKDFIGSEMEIAFNAIYMQDSISACDTDTVWLGLNDSLKPLIVKPDIDSAFTQVIMPMHLDRR